MLAGIDVGDDQDGVLAVAALQQFLDLVLLQLTGEDGVRMGNELRGAVLDLDGAEGNAGDIQSTGMVLGIVFSSIFQVIYYQRKARLGQNWHPQFREPLTRPFLPRGDVVHGARCPLGQRASRQHPHRDGPQ